MKRAELLLNLVIGICGSLIASAIFSRLQKIRWRKIRKEFLTKTKQVTNDTLVTSIIVSYPLRKSAQKLIRPLTVTSIINILILWVLFSGIINFLGFNVILGMTTPPTYIKVNGELKMANIE
jgi:hypothetical protein